MYTTYILFSQSTERFYSGHCEDFDIRFVQHNNGRNKSTKPGIPWEIVYSQTFETRKEAMLLEQRIKKRGAKRFLLNLKKPSG